MASAIKALVCGYSSNVRKQKTIVTLTAFVDDSASEEKDQLAVLAGYAHNADAWEAFSDDWQKTLDAPPCIRYFKMREAESLRREFLGWKPEDRDAKVLAFGQVIESHQPWSIECYMSRAQYKKVVAPIVPYDIRHAYLDLFYALIIKLAQWHHSMGLQVPVDFVFDEQGEMGEDSVIWYHHIKSLQPPEIQALLGSTPIFRDDKKVLPLQAADLLAWHLRRRREKRNSMEHRPVFEKLCSLHAEVHLNTEFLKKIADEMSQVHPMIQTMNTKKSSVMPLVRESLEFERKKKKQ